MKKSILFTLVTLLITNCFSKIVENEISYDDFIKAEANLKLANRYIEAGEIRHAIPLLKNSSAVLQFARESEIALANIYFRTGLVDSAIFFAEKAFAHGAQLEMIKSIQYQKELFNRFNSAHMLYEQEIDLKLYRELQQMLYNDQLYRQLSFYGQSDSLKTLQAKIDSLNFNMLRSIVMENGWPGLKKLGLETPPMISVVASHSSKTDLRFFLVSSIEAAQMNKSSWNDVESLMQSYMYNYRYEERARILEFVEFLNGTELSIASKLPLTVLVKSLFDNPFYIELICFDHASNLCASNQLSTIRSTLIDMGLDDERILRRRLGRSECDCITYGFIPFMAKDDQYDFNTK